ncbi:MAG TPA: hypothetical protein VK444_06915 [Methanobacteriaceae archaeon]|nr:hypothetical protein [Methanobacteriaceae archaeon]
MAALDRDSKGYALSLDLLLALIPLTLILGMVAADMDNVLYQMEDAIFRGSTERVAADTVSTLLETSGTPNDWETTGNVSVPGLAEFDQIKQIPNEGTISSAKLGALNLAQLQNMVGSGYGVYLTVYNISSSGASDVKLKELGSYNSSAQNIVRIERVGSYSKLNIVSKIVGEIRGSNTLRTYNDPPYDFKTSYNSNTTYEYWVVFDNSGYSASKVNVSINSNIINFTNFDSKLIDSTFLKMNSTNPTLTMDNEVKVIANGTPGTKLDVYIVQVARNPSTPSSEINVQNTRSQPCRLEFFLWTI